MVTAKVTEKAATGVEAGASAAPGITKIGSPGQSATGAEAYAATRAYVGAGPGVGAATVARTVEPKLTLTWPPVTAIESPDAAHFGLPRNARSSVSLPRTSGVYDPSPLLTE